MKPTNNQKLRDWEKEFDEKFTYGVLLSASSDLSAGEGRRFRYENQDSEEVKSFIKDLLEAREEALKEPHNTSDGYCCACDYDIAGFEGRLEALKQRVESCVPEPIKGNIGGRGIGFNECREKVLLALTTIIKETK